MVPVDQRRGAIDNVVNVVQSEYFRGPLPHPRHLSEYEKITPGLADRIVSMAEKARERSESRADKVLEHEYADRRLGMCLGFAALIAVLAFGTYLAVNVHWALGASVITVGILGAAVSPFVNGRAKVGALISGKKEPEPPKAKTKKK